MKNDTETQKLQNIVPIAVTFGLSLWAVIAFVKNTEVGAGTGVILFVILVAVWFFIFVIKAFVNFIISIIWWEFIERGTVNSPTIQSAIWWPSVIVSLVAILLIAASL